MKKFFNRITGFLLVLAAIIGLAFSLAGIAGIWVVKNQVTSGIVSGLDLIIDSLNSTGRGLTIIQESFSTMTPSITSVQDTLNTGANTIETAKPLLNSMETLLDKNLPDTIAAVQTSLDTAYDSAKIIDSVLRALTIFNKDSYNPKVPLHEALAQISTNLGDFPQTFADMETSIADTANQADIIQADLKTMAANVSEIQTSLKDYEEQVANYQDSMKATKKQVNTIKALTPRIVDVAVWVLTIFLAWMAIAQLGLLTQGWELLHRPTSAFVPAIEAAAPPPDEEQGETENPEPAKKDE
jgi:uncharacterized phage infection (PIP) family protein YhgE